VKRNAIFGALIWCGLLLVAQAGEVYLTWIELLFLLAPLVVVPLGLHLTGQIEGGLPTSLPERLARSIQGPAALLVVASFFFAPGVVAAALASAWIVFCGLLAMGGFLRTLRGAFGRLDSLCPALAFLYSLVGAAWLIASRLGLNPMGFQEPIVLLTAVHFHYAGFAAALLARSATKRVLADPPGSTWAVALFRIVMAGVLIGPGMLAMGFVVGPRVKLAAALVLALSEIGLAISFVFALNRVTRFSAQLFLTIAAASVAFSMALAAVWAIGEYPLQQFVNLDQMERFHGTANALGFTLCGLLGWILAGTQEAQVEGQPR
jgi:YndJ-like protein